VTESTGLATVIVNRVNGTDGAVSVDYSTTDGTALAGQDYTAASGTLSWANGDSSAKSFSVVIVNDNVANEGTETINLSLLANSLTGGATLGAQGTSVLGISDDDDIG